MVTHIVGYVGSPNKFDNAKDGVVEKVGVVGQEWSREEIPIAFFRGQLWL